MTFRRTLHCLVALLALSTLALAADSGLTALLMNNPKVVAGINVDQAKNSPLGQKLLASIKNEDAELQKLLSETGFDPRQDIREVLVATTVANDPHSGLALVRGTFNASKISGFVKTMGATSSIYNGIEVYLAPNAKNGAGAFAFLGGSILVAGSEASVKAAIDRSKAAPVLNPDLASKIAAWSAKSDAWVISTDAITGFGPFPNKGTAPGGFSVDSVKAATAGIKLGSVVEVNAEATMRSPEDANAFADVIRFVSSMVKSNTNAKNQPPQEFVTMLDSMTLSTTGPLVKINFSMPQSDLDKLMNKGTTAKKAAVR